MTIHPFADDLPFRQPINRWSYWFDNIPGYEFIAPAQFVLTYTESDALLPNHGGITVLLNDKPIASRLVPRATGKTHTWIVSLPEQHFIPGTNELRIMCRHRSLGGRCTDYENDANWITLSKESYLQLTRKNPTPYPLSVYPFPYLDPIADNPVQSRWQLPTPPTPDAIEAMLTVASDWGRRFTTHALRFDVDLGIAPVGRHRMIFGTSAVLPGASSMAMLPDEGILTAGMENGNSVLQVTGGSSSGVMKAVDALASHSMISTLVTTHAAVSRSPQSPPTLPGSRYGKFTFRELGIEGIHLTGAFHQYAVFAIRRPLLSNLGGKSWMEINFLHSASLSAYRSVMSVSINGKNVGSTRLTEATANGGTLKVELPPEIMRDSLWHVTIHCFHDLHNAECDKFYDAIAWTRIEPSSLVFLDQGSYRGQPYLESFPYFGDTHGRVQQPVTCWLPAAPTASQLAAAATIAARAGQVNPGRITWKVVLGSMSETPAGCVIAIGDADGVGHWTPLRDKLHVIPEGGGRYQIAPGVHLLPAAFQQFALLQASQSPWQREAVVYSLLTDHHVMFGQFVDMLTDTRRLNELSGEVALLNQTGKLVSHATLAQAADAPASRNTTRFPFASDTRGMLRYLTLPLALLGFIFVVHMIRRLFGVNKPGTDNQRPPS